MKTDLKDLKWRDLTSPTLSPDKYLEVYSSLKPTYESYNPKIDVLENIKNKLSNKNRKLRIVALGADWCPDCSYNVPKMIKIVKSMDTSDVEIEILYGVMVNALHKPGETIWHHKRSPPEAVNPKFDLTKIPTFYFFDENGTYLGIIVERPKYGSTLEEDTLEIVEKNL
ncbi:hypothetical protein LCGC14_0948600 [marine sediment metagenome]|uniref:Thioredoxin domain-containing protein n=1 Tax=marine sediment metagenome TaxID=412755 RepID=A0A0F9NMP8_9ZZZZ|nr:MAG: hypothetical protein Lokiarch_45810 [Candidatus Lokiarchaeum sp. GC14_75]